MSNINEKLNKKEKKEKKDHGENGEIKEHKVNIENKEKGISNEKLKEKNKDKSKEKKKEENEEKKEHSKEKSKKKSKKEKKDFNKYTNKIQTHSKEVRDHISKEGEIKNNEVRELFNQLKESSKKTSSAKLIEIISNSKEDMFLSYSKERSSEKYKWYLNIVRANDANENNLLYVISRLIGGICSTGSEFREGFTYALEYFIKAFDTFIDYNVMFSAANKESYHKKTETSHFKNNFCKGRIAIYSAILTHSSQLNSELYLEIINSLLKTLESNHNYPIEETSLRAFDSFLASVEKKDFFSSKKGHKVLEAIIVTWFDFIKKPNFRLFYYTSLLILNSYKNLNLFKNFMANLIKTKPKTFSLELTLFQEEDIKFVLTELINKQRDHCLLNYIECFCKEELKFIAVLWNTITDHKLVSELINSSNKSYQYLLSKISIIIINCLGSSNEYLKLFEIFNFNFFKQFLNFEGGKVKLNYILTILNALVNEIKDKKPNSEYSSSILLLFSSNCLSPITFKPIFNFFFERLNIKEREEYVENLLSNKPKKQVKSSEMEIDDSNSELEKEEYFEGNYGNEDYRSQFFTKMNILKNICNLKHLINEDITKMILEHTVKIYLSKNNEPYQEIITYLEDKIVNIFCSSNSKPEEESSNLCKEMTKFNKLIFRLIKSEIKLDEETYSNFKKTLKYIDDSIKTPKKFENSILKDFNHACMKLINLTLFLYLKNPTEMEDTIFDLIELLKETEKDKSELSSNFHKVFTEICLQLNSLGSQTLADLVMKTFKRVSGYLNINSIEVLKDYLVEI